MIDVHKLLEEISTYSTGGLGTTRLAYSEEWRNARKVIIREMEKLGLAIREDSMGNLFGRMAGKGFASHPIGIGSHIDTVPQGGNCDGMVGVVAALSVIEQLQAEGGTQRPVEIILFAAEESSRFAMATMGSKALCGRANFSEWLKMKDKEGRPFEDVIRENGFDPAKLSETIRQLGEWAAFLELHIEQGPMLERAEENIGIVSAIAGATRVKIFIKGRADHSGATPMGERTDALVAAAGVIVAVEEAATSEKRYGTVATIGNVIVSPGVTNVIPGDVELWLDLRGTNKESVSRTFQQIKDEIEGICNRQGCGAKIEMISSEEPVQMNEEIIELLSECADQEKLKSRVMPSGAGHDAMCMARLAPTGMIFIPCKEGISHNPDEYTSPEEIDRGIRVLKRAVERLANQ